MSGRVVDQDHVKDNPGVYFFAYSVPDVIATNHGIASYFGTGANIFHLSVIFSDGCGKVETITAGPEETAVWFKQFGFTPITVQISYLDHPERSFVERSFDTTAWKNPEIQQRYAETNWTEEDFLCAKRLIQDSIDEISSVSYNLGGHNSNSLITLIFERISISEHRRSVGALDHPNLVFSNFYRPGSKYNIFDRSARYYLDLILNYCKIAVVAAFALWNLGIRKFLR